MTSFSIQLKAAYDKKVIKKLEKTVRKTALVVDRQLVRTTPVDTGRAKANWLPSLNTPDVRIVEPGAKHDVLTSTITYTLQDTILITNNLPYIKELNNGSSLQAPKGFVEDALQTGKNTIR